MSLQRTIVQSYFALHHAVLGDKVAVHGGRPTPLPPDFPRTPFAEHVGDLFAAAQPPSLASPGGAASTTPSAQLRPSPLPAAACPPAAPTPAAFQRPPALPQLVYSPTQLGLEEPELMLALDAHFDALGGLAFLQMDHRLDGAFFADMQVVATAEEGARLAAALWPQSALDADGVRALAEQSDLLPRVAAAAAQSGVTLADPDGQRAVALLQLAALEARRTELFEVLLGQVQARCREISERFAAEDRCWAQDFLDASGLGNRQAAFLRPEPSAPPGADGSAAATSAAQAPLAKDARAEAQAHFAGMLGYYLHQLEQARIPPSERDATSFYPCPPAYRAEPLTPYERPPSYGLGDGVAVDAPPPYRPAA